MITRRHRDRPCLHTPCLHTTAPSTACMHPHKSAPIAALPRRVPRPWNCHPSAVEVILHRPQEPPPPQPLSPRVRDASTVLRARLRSSPPSPCACLARCTSAIDLGYTAFENRPSSQPPRMRRSTSSELATPTDALRNSKRRSKFVQHSQSSKSASLCSTALTLATKYAETRPEQSSRTGRRCGEQRRTWKQEKTI